jgi:hypothetical protein
MTPRQRLAENPFFVLDLPADAPRADVERTAQRLLAELGVGRESAATYRTPFGRAARTTDLVRAAVAELRDPARRVAHEVWARVPLREDPEPAAPSVPWPIAARALGARSP